MDSCKNMGCGVGGLLIVMTSENRNDRIYQLDDTMSLNVIPREAMSWRDESRSILKLTRE